MKENFHEMFKFQSKKTLTEFLEHCGFSLRNVDEFYADGMELSVRAEGISVHIWSHAFNNKQCMQ